MGATEKSSLVNAGFHRRGAYQILAGASGAPSPWFEVSVDEQLECLKVKKVVVFYNGDGDRTYQICESCATKVKTMFKTGVAK